MNDGIAIQSKLTKKGIMTIAIKEVIKMSQLNGNYGSKYLQIVL